MTPEYAAANRLFSEGIDCPKIYQQHVEALLIRQNRWGYRTACEYLLKIRTLCEKLEDSEGWINYLTDLRKRTNRLRSFKEEMANASL
jgi:uncharacterized Zn finger protein